ncbi:GNAT family N-acetyltransferase [Nocardia fusca]|uniref:GNAT family N-acetyltransferase n=1 Tax=Nocardia fusca TaxID=941183 RepID=UPI0007A75F1D|nr:GNAT family N-acetyltransferase [Nocardia fusca]
MAIIHHPETLIDEFVIQLAEAGEEEIVLDLLAEAAAWLRSRGIEQWPTRFPSDSVRRQIARREALLVSAAGRPIATLAIADSDNELWGEDNAPAYYVSRLAVARHAVGAHLGYRILDWISDKAVQRGYRYLRLATASNNPRLRQYYETAGFEHIADPPHARWPTSLYQRDIG